MIHGLLCLLLQGTWVVDEDGGPGVNFTDLPPAVAAAADGDLILVKAGTYTHFSLSGKGLRILGEGAGTTLVSLGNSSTTISNVPPTSAVYVDQIGFGGFGPVASALARLVVSGGGTRVVLADVTVVSPTCLCFVGLPPALSVAGATVHVHRSTLSGSDSQFQGVPGSEALRVDSGGLVHVSSSQLLGGDGRDALIFAGGNSAGGPAAVVQGSTSRLWVVDSEVRAGDSGYPPPCGSVVAGPGAPGILVESGFLRVSGGATSLVEGGTGSCACLSVSPGGPGILATGTASGAVHGVQVVGGTSCGVAAPAVVGSGILLGQPPLPVLEIAGSLTLSGTVTFHVSNPSGGNLCVVALDDGAAHFGIPGPFVGEFLLGPPPALPFLFLAASLLPSGEFTATLPLAGLPPSFAHVPFHFQSAVLDPGSGSWRLSNATAATLRP